MSNIAASGIITNGMSVDANKCPMKDSPEFAAVAAEDAATGKSRAVCGRFEISRLATCDDRDEVLTAVNRNGISIQHAKDIFKNDKEIAFAAVKQNPLAFCVVSSEMRQDPDIVRTALAADGLNLIYVESAELKDDEELGLIAVGQNGRALIHCSKRLQGLKNVVMTAVSNDGRSLHSASPELRADVEIAVAACSEDHFAYQYVDASIRAHPDVIVATATGKSGPVLSDAPESLVKDEHFLEAVARRRGELAVYSDEHWGSCRLEQLLEMLAPITFNQLGTFVLATTDPGRRFEMAVLRACARSSTHVFDKLHSASMTSNRVLALCKLLYNRVPRSARYASTGHTVLEVLLEAKSVLIARWAMTLDLYLGRYRFINDVPFSRSATGVVVAHAVDTVAHAEGEPECVVLKLMHDRLRFEREIRLRLVGEDFDSLHGIAVDLIRWHTPQANALYDEVVDSLGVKHRVNFTVSSECTDDFGVQLCDGRVVAVTAATSQSPLLGPAQPFDDAISTMSFPYVLVLDRVECSVSTILARDRFLIAHRSADLVISLVQQVVCRVQTLHKEGLVHANLNPDHLLLCGDPERGWHRRVVLCSFGNTVASKSHGDVVLVDNHSGLEAYTAPEAIRCLDAGQSVHLTPALDTWSLGIMLYELTTGSPLFPQQFGSGCIADPKHRLRLKNWCGLTRDEIDRVFAPMQWKGLYSSLTPGSPQQDESSCTCSAQQRSDLQRVIAWCLHPDPTQRPSMAMLALDRTFGGNIVATSSIDSALEMGGMMKSLSSLAMSRSRQVVMTIGGIACAIPIIWMAVQGPKFAFATIDRDS